MTATYEVKVTRSGKWWAIEVPALKFGYSQARRLAEVEPTVRELIGGLTETPEDSFEIAVRVDVPGADAIETAARLRSAADAARQTADQATRDAALTLVAQRIPVRDVATMLHVSQGWVSVLTRDESAAA